MAHGALGGFMSAAQGGKFGAGFLSGGFGSAFGGKVGKWLQNARDFPKFIGTTIAGGISGGVGSRIAGGKFWDGFRNGAISAGLNHGLHEGYFGENLAATAITGKFRHLFGPDAVLYSGDVTSAMGLGAKMEKGYLITLRGKQAGGEWIEGVAGVTGLPTFSGEISQTKLYYSGKINNIKVSTFTGKYYEFNAGATMGISVGAHVSYSKVQNTNNFVLGIGYNLGVGFNPVYGLDINFQHGTIGTKTPFKNK